MYNADIQLHFTLTLILSSASSLILHTYLAENHRLSGTFVTILRFKMLDFFFFFCHRQLKDEQDRCIYSYKIFFIVQHTMKCVSMEV